MIPYQMPSIPRLVRIKPQALDRLGIYLRRDGINGIVLLASEGLPTPLMERVRESCRANNVECLREIHVTDASIEGATAMVADFPARAAMVVGLGGGKALDVAKFLAHLVQRPYCSVPTSLSNDGFCSPQASLTVRGARRSLGAAMPCGVVIDTEACIHAPRELWWSGVGDLVAKITAVHDWRLAFHADGTAFHDFAALVSIGSVHQFASHTRQDTEGVRLLATALMLSGVAMELCGNSRPASGSEHLVSHWLDRHGKHPRLHGLQVGVAACIITRLQGQGEAMVDGILEPTGFWTAFEREPLDLAEWLRAFREAPAVKPGYHTILSTGVGKNQIREVIGSHAKLAAAFGL